MTIVALQGSFEVTNLNYNLKYKNQGEFSGQKDKIENLYSNKQQIPIIP